MSKLPAGSEVRPFVKRRDFLKGSVAAVGTFVAGQNLTASNANSAESPSETIPKGLTSAKLVELPAISYRAVDERTNVPVTVTVGKFLISPTELTQREFEEIMGYNPSFHKGSKLPVETVSWWEAIRYCNLRSLREGLDPCYDLDSGSCDMCNNGYRLLTEAEWVYAAGPPPPANRQKINPCGAPIPATSGELTSAPSHAASHIANLGDSDTKSVDRLLHDLKVSGTKPVGSYPPNQYSLYDMYGNVWEWCNDFFDPQPAPERSYNPSGPERGLERVIRGGSFISNSSAWAPSPHSDLLRPSQGNAWCCMKADYKSRFTGFRVCRSIPRAVPPPLPDQGIEWFKPYNSPPPGYEDSIGNLSPLVTPRMTLSDWEDHRRNIKAKWLKLLGEMETTPPAPVTRFIETVKDESFTGKIMDLQTEPDCWGKIMVTMPYGTPTRPRPVVIVPFYDVDDPVDHDLSGCFFDASRVESFARMAAQRGHIAVAIRWWEADYGEADSEAVANLKLRHPRCTGLGKWVWDVHRLVDYLYTLPEVDYKHIGIIGHSLGGKMALYAGAFDERITAVVSLEPGIGFAFSNYDDYWYFGDFIRSVVDEGTDQHELLGLIAPRPFLLIGGDMCDTAKSWYYINAARQVYNLYGKRLNIGYFNYHNGQHMPTPEAGWRSMEWLVKFLEPAE